MNSNYNTQNRDASGGLLGCFGRRRRKRNEADGDVISKLNDTEGMLSELQNELRLLREHRQHQEENVRRLQDEIGEIKESEGHLKEVNLNLKHDLRVSHLENKSCSINMDSLEKDKNKLEIELKSLSESLIQSKLVNSEEREDMVLYRKQIEDMKQQMLSSQEHVERMTSSSNGTQAKVDCLENLTKKNGEKIKHLDALKLYLAKCNVEKDQELTRLRALYAKDRDAFQKVREYQTEKFERLKDKHNNVLHYLVEMSNNCKCSTKSYRDYTNMNSDTIPPPRSSTRNYRHGRPNYTGTIKNILTEPNTTVLSTTVDLFDLELYRYRKMNELLEDKIEEYEPEFTISYDSINDSSIMGFSDISDLPSVEDVSSFQYSSEEVIGEDLQLYDIEDSRDKIFK